ncbi:MAG TPA: PEP-CTERM sorting domain-containing protein [Candidatus Acidoferrum sp.]|nr:PEP-CTERM sorting domain-containing protein [Candidatus Acidoferrum sp.]
MRQFAKAFVLMAVVALFSAMAFGTSVPVGIVSYDVTGTGTFQFDITNQTGPNSGADFPVTNTIFLSSLNLTVNLSNGTTETFGSSYFTLNPDGISFSGNPLSTLIPATSATLTGNFSTTTFNLNNGTSVTVVQGFRVTLTDPSGTLNDGDSALIVGNTTTATTPEPETLTLMGTGLAALMGLKRKYLAVGLKRLRTVRLGATTIVLSLCCVMLVVSASTAARASVKLDTWTNPPSGAAGSSNTNLVGSGFPSGAISPGSVTITIATSCFGSGAVTTKALRVTKILGTTERIEFLIPATITKTGNYFAWITGSTTTGTSFASSNCSEVTITASTRGLSSCLPSSSLGVLTGTSTVQAYVPNGYWEGGASGVQFVPIEGAGSTASISTPSTVNACSSNSITGQTVCTADNTDVYLISGSTLNKTLTSGSNSTAGFSGGSCENCGVAIDALTNTAYIEMGYNSGSAIQALDLNKNTFTTPMPTTNEISENISVDAARNLILSPDESGSYDLFKIGATGSLTEYSNSVGGTLDSAAEDCSTGIALASDEAFPVDVFVTDLTQAKFTTGSPNTWTAPSQFLTIPDFEGFSAGTDGISVAPGNAHLGIVTGEFGGNQIGALSLPASSGSGTPNLVDWVGAAVPITPDGFSFSDGFDPHTITAYTSPNTQNAYGVIADWATGEPTYLAIVDLKSLLAAPRLAGVDAGGNPCSTCTHSVDPSYDLVAHGVIRFVKTN